MDTVGGTTGVDVHRRRSSALYGLIIGGAVLATSGTMERLSLIALSLVATLAVYWVAETYVHLMAERGVERRELSFTTTIAIAKDGLPLITVSAVPLAVLLVAGLLGASTVRAAEFALYADTIVLLVAGYRISRDAGLVGFRLALSVLITGLLGMSMVILKIALNH